MTEEAPLLSRWALAAAVAFACAAGGASLAVMPPGVALVTGLLALLMALITLIDFRHFIIPDVLSLPAVPLGIIANIVVFHPDDWMAGFSESVLGAVLAGGAFFLLRALWFRLRGIEGLGLGDVKLAAVAGAWLGPEMLPAACLAAALGGLAAAVVLLVLPGRQVRMSDHMPFGSFMAPVILLFWAWRVLDAVPFW
ncbi:prepilin peptidase [Aestuariivirga litoralis]|uniref:prepilin peptidase n=1 Tax=Aestuariivirga litoralis TaxID=2650924 RepID=UPI00137A19DA|nr:A24 family peptidase [Aestuariivirga litoralis]